MPLKMNKIRAKGRVAEAPEPQNQVMVADIKSVHGFPISEK